MRGSWTDTEPGQPGEVSDGGLHVMGVEGAATLSGISRALVGAPRRRHELLERAGGHDLPRAVVVGGGQAVLAIAASTSSRSPPRTAVIPVGVVAGGPRHRLAALADQDHRLLGGDHPGADGGADLADTVAGDRADLVERVGGVREHLEDGHQAVATSSGWAISVCRIVSASASVP